MSGSAERALGLRHRAVIEDLRALPDWPSIHFASSTGFRFVVDHDVDRDVADISAVAQELGVMIRAVTEQPFWPMAGAPGEPGEARETGRGEHTGADRATLAQEPAAAAGGAGGRGEGAGGARLAGAAHDERARPDTGPAGAAHDEGARPDAGSSAGHGGSPSPPSSPSSATAGESTGEWRDGSATASTLLAQPAAVAGRERIEQGCRALASSWYEEAAELFLGAAEHLPTDALAWFGAGLAASRFDPALGAEHLAKASRYLLDDDPAGSAYAAIVAAGLAESAGDVPTARRLLQARLEELGQACPALALHLVRLGAPPRQLDRALLVDPLLEADVRVLRLDPQGEAVARRRSRTEREIEQLDEAIASLRALETATAAGSTERPAPGHRSDQPRSRPPDPGRLPLTRLELRLAERLVACRREIDRSRDVVDRRLRARRAVEADLAAASELAATDLGHRTTIPFFLFSMGAVIVVIATFAAGQALAEAAPALGPLPDVAVWLSRVLVVVLAARQLIGAWWPHRSFSRARRAKLLIPQLEWQVSQLRQVEFDIRRSYNRARREAELRMQRILDRRAGLVPERPRFISPNRPERRLE